MKEHEEDELILISHILCPYVQRVVAALAEAGRTYKRIDIDLANKPDWFLSLSPLGKVPVLVVNDDLVLFESSVINEYLNETNAMGLLAEEALPRARQRAWVEFASASLDNIGRMYNANNELKFTAEKKAMMSKLSHLEENLGSAGFFYEERFSLVDAAFAPVFRYLHVFEELLRTNFLQHYPKLQRWYKLLYERSSIQQAVRPDYPELLRQFIARRESYLGEIAKNAQMIEVNKFAMNGTS